MAMNSPENIPRGDQETEKRKNLEALCQGEPDALYVLSGISEVINPVTQEKDYKPGSYGDVDWKGNMTGGKARALAAVELSKYFPEATVAVNSNTFNISDPKAPTDADVMAEYIERKGVEHEKIIKQDRSTTTFTELIELVKYIAEHKWEHPVVIAGETQKPRAIEMLKRIATLKDPAGAWKDPAFQDALNKIKEVNPKITIVSSEDILPIRDNRYTELIQKARETETWKKREKLDRQAVEDLVTGKYWNEK